MIISPHASVGAAIGVIVPNPLLVVPLAIASHYLLDTVPHWQETLAPYEPTYKTYIRLPVDIFLAAGIIVLIIHIHPNALTSIWAGAIAANIPDLDSVLLLWPQILKKGLIKKYWDWHCRIQNETSSWLGVWTQTLTIGFAFLVAYIR